MSTLLQRREVAEAAKQRFRGAPLVYGKSDCVRMAAFVLRKMGRRPQLGKAGTYSTLLGASRALKRAGFETLPDALDALGLERIPPAMRWMADLVIVPGEGPFGGSLQVALNNGRTLGWHQDVEGAEVLQPLEFIGAWRV